MTARRIAACVLTIGTAATLVACNSDQSTPAAVTGPVPIASAKPPSDPRTTFTVPLADADLGLKSDHQFSGVYADGVCGVNSQLFLGGTGDAIMDTRNPKFTDNRCSLYPRTMTIDYGDGVVQSSTVFINVREIQNGAYRIPIGGFAKRGLHVNETRCDGLVWQGTLGDGTNTGGADSVIVTRTSANSWTVETQPYPDNEAYCKASGAKYNIAVRFTITSSTSLPSMASFVTETEVLIADEDFAEADADASNGICVKDTPDGDLILRDANEQTPSQLCPPPFKYVGKAQPVKIIKEWLEEDANMNGVICVKETGNGRFIVKDDNLNTPSQPCPPAYAVMGGGKKPPIKLPFELLAAADDNGNHRVCLRAKESGSFIVKDDDLNLPSQPCPPAYSLEGAGKEAEAEAEAK